MFQNRTRSILTGIKTVNITKRIGGIFTAPTSLMNKSQLINNIINRLNLMSVNPSIK